MVSKKIIIIVVSMLIATVLNATEGKVKLVSSAYKPLNVVTTSTDSVMANAVARHFGQILYIEKYSIRSGLVIRETKRSNNTHEITLETPLRVITTFQFLIKQPRSWTAPELVAQEFVAAAQKDGLLVSRNL